MFLSVLLVAAGPSVFAAVTLPIAGWTSRERKSKSAKIELGKRTRGVDKGGPFGSRWRSQPRVGTRNALQEGRQLGSRRCALPMETAWLRTTKIIPNVLITNASMAAIESHVTGFALSLKPVRFTSYKIIDDANCQTQR